MGSHIILVGAPGSGKGTQSSKLVSEKSYKHVSTGDLLRAEIDKASELGLEVKSIMSSGQLVSDDLVVRLLKSNLDLKKDKYIFDGYPRNVLQAETLTNDVLHGCEFKVFYFKIEEDRLLLRLTNRRTCKNCGEIYNLATKRPKISGQCDVCGSHDLIQRPDDTESIVEERLKVFSETTFPVLDYYRKAGKLIELDAEASEEKIYQDILDAL